MKYFGLTSSGSKRWLDLYFMNLQPSELMKIGLILFLAKYYHRISIDKINSIKYLLLTYSSFDRSFNFSGYSTRSWNFYSYCIRRCVVAWLAGVRAKFFVYSGVAMLALLPIAISFLKPYQKSRILTFLNPERDPLGAGYQIIQSKIAIGSGGLFGKGFLNGSQSYLRLSTRKTHRFYFYPIFRRVWFFWIVIYSTALCFNYFQNY